MANSTSAVVSWRNQAITPTTIRIPHLLVRRRTVGRIQVPSRQLPTGNSSSEIRPWVGLWFGLRVDGLVFHLVGQHECIDFYADPRPELVESNYRIAHDALFLARLHSDYASFEIENHTRF